MCEEAFYSPGKEKQHISRFSEDTKLFFFSEKER